MSSPCPLVTIEYVLPDLFKLCPLKPLLNPHYSQVALESSVWINSFGIFAGCKLDDFMRGGSELLCARTYPDADYDKLRICCDFVNALFAVDDITDEQDEGGARTTGTVFLDAMRDSRWDSGTSIGRLCRDLADRFAKGATPGCYRRLTQLCAEYIEAVAYEAGVRSRGVALEIDTYMRMRRDASAVPFCFGLSEFIHGSDLPDEVYEDPIFRQMYIAATDLVCISNDLYSYKREHLAGHKVNNFVYVQMECKGIKIQEACDLAGVHYGELIHSFLDNKGRLPSWGAEIDPAVAAMVMCMENWVVGSLHWSFETRRYFGDLKDEVRRTRVVHFNTYETSAGGGAPIEKTLVPEADGAVSCDSK